MKEKRRGRVRKRGRRASLGNHTSKGWGHIPSYGSVMEAITICEVKRKKKKDKLIAADTDMSW